MTLLHEKNIHISIINLFLIHLRFQWLAVSFLFPFFVVQFSLSVPIKSINQTKTWLYICFVPKNMQHIIT